MKTKMKIAVIALIGMSFGVKAQWNSNGINSSTGNLTLDGSYLNLNTPITTGGWARGFFNIDTDKVTRIGGVGLLGSKDKPIHYYMAHGTTPWTSGLGIYVKTNGNVGIGTTNPSLKLEVNGPMKLKNGNTDLMIYRDSDVGDWSLLRTNTGNGIGLIGQPDVMALSISRITSNVGIGTTDTKGYKLGVKGKIVAEEVKVATYSNWSDFVFYDNYKLPTLKDVEKHIKEKGHLKDIPSAKEVEENGFFLGEMDSKLLQKIEELTLYTIQQQKEIEKLKSTNHKLAEIQIRLDKLESETKKKNGL